LSDFRNLGPFGSNKKLPDFCNRPELLLRNRVQIDLPRELLPVKHEVAGSSPVAPARCILFTAEAAP